MSGILYLVATPIGNLSDITLRAIEVLKEVDIIAAEDTRHTLKLLNHLNISKPMISYYRHNEEIKSEKLIEKLLNGNNVALVSDAGTPGISDPGEEIVKKAIENEIKIVPIPGACALINALIISGISSKEFVFLGFLPTNKKLRNNKLKEIEKENKTIIMYEAPHKLNNTLTDLEKILKNRKIALVKEITKIHEQVIRGTAKELIDIIDNPKGEFVIIVEPNDEVEKINFENYTVEEHYQYYENEGLEKKDIIKKIAKDRGVNKNEIYMKFLNK